MKRTLFAVLPLVLAACEGEPPKTSASVAVATPSEPVPVAAAEEPAAPAPVAGGALPPCACNCGCPGGVAPAAAVAGAPPTSDGGVAAAPVAVTPPAALVGTISGTVTSTPKWAAGSAVVYLDGLGVAPTAKMSATVVNRMMNFIPNVSVIPVGGKMVFRNDDPFPHNVFSPDGEHFNMGMIPPQEARARTFKEAGAYSLLCNVHPGMLGYVVVAPSSYFAKADAQGHFTIRAVPPGSYTIAAWAPRLPVVSQPVTVKDGDVLINFELHR